MKTRILITIDTEFSIAGAFRDPQDRRPVGEAAVACNARGRSQGLGFVLETLSAHRLPATFFVEAFNAHFFGDAPMASIARRIRAAGHDVQLHIHPAWAAFKHPDWAKRLGPTPPNDSMAGRSREEATALIAEGLAIFERWGLPRPLALRTGSLRCDRTVYEAMNAVDLPIASNVGLAIYRPAETELRLTGGRHLVAGVLEIPILTYRDVRIPGVRHQKNLTITGCSWPEIRWLLRIARARNMGTIVLLTHPFEFAKYDESFTDVRPNRINQRRFAALCAFLDRHRDEYETATFGGSLEHWQDGGEEPAPDLATPLWLTAGRLVVNRLNDRMR